MLLRIGVGGFNFFNFSKLDLIICLILSLVTLNFCPIISKVFGGEPSRPNLLINISKDLFLATAFFLQKHLLLGIASLIFLLLKIFHFDNF